MVRRASNALISVRRRHCRRCGKKLWWRQRWCVPCFRAMLRELDDGG